MIRHRALQIVLVIVGLLFLAGLYPLFRWETNPAEQMLGSVYATLGIFLLLAAWNTSGYRSLIAFTAWSSLVHAATMAIQATRELIPRDDLLRAVLPLGLIGILLIVLAPARNAGDTKQADKLTPKL